MSMHLYGKGESLSLTYFPGHSTSKMRLKRGSNSPHKLPDGPPKNFTAINIDRKVNMESGGGMMAL